MGSNRQLGGKLLKSREPYVVYPAQTVYGEPSAVVVVLAPGYYGGTATAIDARAAEPPLPFKRFTSR